MALCPAGIHPVKHLTPILRLRAAGTRLKTHQSRILIILAGKQGFQPAGFHFLTEGSKAFLQLRKHGIIIFLSGHFTNGHQILPGGYHFLVPLYFTFCLLGLHDDFLALFRVVPEAGCFLHGMKPLQFIFQAIQVQRIRQGCQRRTDIIQFLTIAVKLNIHGSILSFPCFLHFGEYYIRIYPTCKEDSKKICKNLPFTGRILLILENQIVYICIILIIFRHTDSPFK